MVIQRQLRVPEQVCHGLGAQNVKIYQLKRILSPPSPSSRWLRRSRPSAKAVPQRPSSASPRGSTRLAAGSGFAAYQRWERVVDHQWQRDGAPGLSLRRASRLVAGANARAQATHAVLGYRSVLTSDFRVGLSKHASGHITRDIAEVLRSPETQSHTFEPENHS